MNEITLKNETAQFDALKKLSTDIAEQCNKLTVADDVTLAIATQNLSKANEVAKQIENVRVALKKPYKDAGDQIDSLAKTLATPIKTSIENGKLKILAYDKKKKDEALAEQNRILSIKNAITMYSTDAIQKMDKCKTIAELKTIREQLIVNAPLDKWSEFKDDFINTRNTLNEYAKSLKTKLENPTQSDPEEQTAIKEAIVTENASIGQVEVTATIVPKLSGTRKTWTFEVIDFNQIPRDWLILNEDIVKKYISENKETFVDGCIIKGIKYYQKESLTIR